MIRFNAESVNVVRDGRTLAVELDGLDCSEVVKVLLEDFTIGEILDGLDSSNVLDEIGKEAAIHHFGITEAPE